MNDIKLPRLTDELMVKRVEKLHRAPHAGAGAIALTIEGEGPIAHAQTIASNSVNVLNMAAGSYVSRWTRQPHLAPDNRKPAPVLRDPAAFAKMQNLQCLSILAARRAAQ